MMTDRYARIAALALVFASVFCAGLAARMAFGPGATPLSRAAGGAALAIDGVAVFMNALAYLMHCPGKGDGEPTPLGIDGGSGVDSETHAGRAGSTHGCRAAESRCGCGVAIDIEPAGAIPAYRPGGNTVPGHGR